MKRYRLTEIPKFFFTARHIAMVSVGVVAFSMLFIWGFQPFSNVPWVDFQQFQKSGNYIPFWLVCGLVLLARQLIFNALAAFQRITYLHVIFWSAVELLLISTVYILMATPGVQITAQLLFGTALCLGSVMTIPFALITLLSALLDRSEQYQSLQLGVKAQAFAPDATPIQLTDYKDEVKLTLPCSAIYYAEAQDNYIEVCYDQDGAVKKFLFRCPIHKFELSIAGTSLVRCQRSYIVNLDHIKFFVKGHNSGNVVLDTPDSKTIPVSKTYYKVLPASIINGKDSASDISDEDYL